MKKIKDLARELSVSSDDIIFFLKHSAFAFKHKLSTEYAIDSVWEEKVRNLMKRSGPRQKVQERRKYVWELALELGVKSEFIIEFLKSNYSFFSHSNLDAGSLMSERWVTIVRDAFKTGSAKIYAAKPQSSPGKSENAAKSAEQQKKSQTSSSTNVYGSVLDVPKTSSETKVYKSVLDVPTTKSAEQTNIAQKDIKNILASMQENILRHISGNNERFWKDFLSLVKDAKFKVDNDKVKLAFAGKMKAGKSTLVNMMLGEDLAKIGLKSTTHIITEFHYTENQPRVEFRSKEDQIIEQYHLDAAGMEKARFKMEDDTDKNCYSIRIYCDNEILKKFVLVDIPGAGDANEDLNTYTDEYLTQNEVSTIIWVKRMQGGWGITERNLFNKLIALKKNLYVVFNQQDTTDTSGDIEKYLKEFNEYYPDFPAERFDRLSVQRAEKPDREKIEAEERVKPKALSKSQKMSESEFEAWIKERVDKELDKAREKYDELCRIQEKLKNKFKDNAVDIRDKNARAIISLLPGEIQKKLEMLRTDAVKDRENLRDRFFKVLKNKILSAVESVSKMEEKLNDEYERCAKGAARELRNGKTKDWVVERFYKPFFRKNVIDIVTSNFDNKFSALNTNDNFLGLDFFQKTILFKELVIQAGQGDYHRSDYFQEVCKNLVKELKLMSVLIVLDCLKNFISKHNEIWLTYLDIKKYVVDECLKKSGIDYSEALLLTKNEEFVLSPRYIEWAGKTLAAYKKQILSDGWETESENRIAEQMNRVFGIKSASCSLQTEQKDCPMIFRLKLESCNRNEIRDILNCDQYLIDGWFDKTLSLLNSNSEDFNDFFVKCTDLFSSSDASLSTGGTKRDTGINFLPEEEL